MIDWRCEAWLSNDDCTLRGLWDGGTFSTNCISQTAVSGVNTFVMNQGKNITVALTGAGLEGARGSVWAMICQTAAGGSTHRKCNKQRANDVNLRRLQVAALQNDHVPPHWPVHQLSRYLRSGGWLFYESTYPWRPPRRPGDSSPRDTRRYMQVRLYCCWVSSSFLPQTTNAFMTLSQWLLGWTPAHPSTWLRTNNTNQIATVKKIV